MVADVSQHVLERASQRFDSIWISDHHMTEDRFRLECWTQLTWVAARFPGPMLGTIVMANSYRHPPMLAKMAASLQVFSQGRFILGYGEVALMNLDAVDLGHNRIPVLRTRGRSRHDEQRQERGTESGSTRVDR